MSIATRTELERSLSARRLLPLYFLFGPETYLRTAAARMITETALSGTALREFNETAFSILSSSIYDAIATAMQLPMMSPRRVVRVNDFAQMRETEEEALIKYLRNPVESTVMILVANEPDKRKTFTKVLFEQCLAVEFPYLKDAEAKAWLRSRLKQLQIGADDRVLSEIVSLVGTDVQTLNSEFDKLISASVQDGRITSEMVDDLISQSRELSNFEFGDHLLSGNRKRALATLHRLLESGSQPVMLIGLIAGNYRRLAIAKDLMLRGAHTQIFKYIQMPPFKRNDFLAIVQRSDPDTIARGIQLIAAADLAVKTSQATPRLQLELLVCELCA